MTSQVLWVIRLPWRTPPLSLNDRGHWAAKAARTARVRRDVVALAAAHRLPTGLDRVRVHLVYVPRDRRRRDTDNLVATLKPICDALAAGTGKHPGYGLVADDTPEFMSKPEPLIAAPDPKDPHLRLLITDIGGGRGA